MTKLGVKFVFMFLILVGVVSGLLAVRLAIGIFLPEWYQLPVLLLPEDLLSGVLVQFLLELVTYLPSLGLSTILLAFSFWLRPEELPRGDSRGIPASQSLVRFSVLAIVCSGVFALLVLFAQPWLQARIDEFAFRQSQARELEDAYLELKKTNLAYGDELDLEARYSLVKRLGTLRPTQNTYAGKERFDYDFELQIIKTHFDMEEFFRLRLLPGSAETLVEDQITVELLLVRAQQALDSPADDAEFQANLLAYTAFRRLMNALDNGQTINEEALTKARELVNESWVRIRERTLLSDERLKASYYFRKGKSLGDYNFQNYLEAYYGFQELHREDPTDVEVARYREMSLEAVRETVLFRQEMDVLFHVPGSNNLVFLNRPSPREVIRIGKMLDTSQGVFVKDFEFIRYTDTGEVLLHWTAPYGAWTSRGIDFRIWEKNQPVPNFPVVLAENAENPYDPANTSEPPLFVPRLTVRDIRVISTQGVAPQTLGTWDLLTQGKSIEVLGYSALPLQTEFLSRLVSPFAYFVLFVLVFALAWHFRARTAGKSWWVILPLLPLVAEVILQILIWLARLAMGGLVEFFPLQTAAMAIGITLFVSAVVALVFAYGQLRKEQP